MKRLKLLLIIGGSALALSGCVQSEAETTDPQSPPTSKAMNASDEELAVQAQQLRQQIGVLTEDAQADDVKQCRLLAIGAKPCGGPEEYVVYSTRNTDEDELKALADEYAEIREQWHEANQMVSNCMMTPEPQVQLVDGACTAGKPGQLR